MIEELNLIVKIDGIEDINNYPNLKSRIYEARNKGNNKFTVKGKKYRIVQNLDSLVVMDA